MKISIIQGNRKYNSGVEFSRGGGGHFHSKVIDMLVEFLGYKILILVFLGSSGKFCVEIKFWYF